MTSLPTKWNPYSTLSIEKSRTTCYGWAPSKGRQCANPVALANRQEAERLLSKLSRLDPMTTNLDAWLRELAHRILCKRNHQDQAEGVVRRWKLDIEGYLEGQGDEVQVQAEEDEIEAEIARLRELQEWKRRAGGRQRVEAPIRNPRVLIDSAPATTKMPVTTVQSSTPSREGSNTIPAPSSSFGHRRTSNSGNVPASPSSFGNQRTSIFGNVPAPAMRPALQGYEMEAVRIRSFRVAQRQEGNVVPEVPPRPVVSRQMLPARRTGLIPSGSSTNATTRPDSSTRADARTTRFGASSVISSQSNVTAPAASTVPWSFGESPIPRSTNRSVSPPARGQSSLAETPTSGFTFSARNPFLGTEIYSPNQVSAPPPYRRELSFSRPATRAAPVEAAPEVRPAFAFTFGSALTPLVGDVTSTASEAEPTTPVSDPSSSASEPEPTSPFLDSSSSASQSEPASPASPTSDSSSSASEPEPTTPISDSSSPAPDPEPTAPTIEPAPTSILPATDPEPTAPTTEPALTSSSSTTAERSLSGDCSICYESLLDGNSLVCCKAQCKQYFHGECMGIWLQEARPKRCPYCRADWVQ